MRKILFRGKTFANEWVVGDGYFSDETKRIIARNNRNFGESYSTNYFEVIHDTVGQFTGLTDKNGVEIYEGDIVKPNIKYITRNCQVVFDSLCYKLATKEWTNWFSELVWSDLEVIGNIYENPELLR